MARRISMGARREVVWAVAERYAAAGRREKGRILDELTATTGWHRKHAVRALSGVAARQANRDHVRRRPARSTTRHSDQPVGGASTQVLATDALIALWEASDRSGWSLEPVAERLVGTVRASDDLGPPDTLPRSSGSKAYAALRHRGLLLLVSAATIGRMLVDVKIAAAGGRRPAPPRP
jgi:hypothetical protein